MEKSKDTMGIVSNISYIDYIEKNPKSSIRHICNIGISITTLITDSQSNKRSWDDFRDKSYTFGVDYSESSSYIALERILKFLLNENQHKMVELKYDANTISNALKNKVIDKLVIGNYVYEHIIFRKMVVFLFKQRIFRVRQQIENNLFKFESITNNRRQIFFQFHIDFNCQMFELF